MLFQSNKVSLIANIYNYLYLKMSYSYNIILLYYIYYIYIIFLYILYYINLYFIINKLIDKRCYFGGIGSRVDAKEDIF
jgi:hypothetical protein